MKAIMKTMPSELELRYDEKFTSEENTNVLRDLIPRLIEAMKSRYSLSYKQIKM